MVLWRSRYIYIWKSIAGVFYVFFGWLFDGWWSNEIHHHQTHHHLGVQIFWHKFPNFHHGRNRQNPSASWPKWSKGCTFCWNIPLKAAAAFSTKLSHEVPVNGEGDLEGWGEDQNERRVSASLPECTQLTAFRSWFQMFWMFTQKRREDDPSSRWCLWNWATSWLSDHGWHHLKNEQSCILGVQEHHSNVFLWIGKNALGYSTHIPNSNLFSLPSQCLQKNLPSSHGSRSDNDSKCTMVLGKVCFFVQSGQGFFFEDMPIWWFQLW